MKRAGAVQPRDPGMSLSLHPPHTRRSHIPLYPSLVNLFHPEWFQCWDPGVLLLHGYQLLVCHPVGRRKSLSLLSSSCDQPSFQPIGGPDPNLRLPINSNLQRWSLQFLEATRRSLPVPRPPDPSPDISSQYNPPSLCPPLPTKVYVSLPEPHREHSLSPHMKPLSNAIVSAGPSKPKDPRLLHISHSELSQTCPLPASSHLST